MEVTKLTIDKDRDGGSRETNRPIKRKCTRAQQAARVANAAKARAVRAERAAQRDRAAQWDRAAQRDREAAVSGAVQRDRETVLSVVSEGAVIGVVRLILRVMSDPEFQAVVRVIGDVIRRHAETSGQRD